MPISYVSYENINSLFKKALKADKEYLYRVGHCFLYGDGVGQNTPLAYLFLSTASDMGNRLALEKIKYLNDSDLYSHSIYEAIDILNEKLSDCELINHNEKTMANTLKEKLLSLLL